MGARSAAKKRVDRAWLGHDARDLGTADEAAGRYRRSSSCGPPVTAAFCQTDRARGIETMSRLFERLFRFQKPTVAAVNGHAIAGGAVLTCACDYRISSEGSHRIGFSEVAVGVPFPRWALEILRFAVGSEHVRNLALVAR